MISATQITNTEIFSFIAVLVFKSLSRKVFFINRKDNRSCKKVGYFLRKQQILQVNYCKIINGFGREILRILLKRLSNHLSVLFQFA